jgi:hypothetical protein
LNSGFRAGPLPFGKRAARSFFIGAIYVSLLTFSFGVKSLGHLA